MQNQPLTFPWRSNRHDGPIHGLSWAHPSFGSILASCSFDGKVFIWKENEGPQKGWSKVKEHLLHTASGEFVDSSGSALGDGDRPNACAEGCQGREG